MNDFADRISKLSPRKLALLAQELQTRLVAAQAKSYSPIAIVGMGCRFPGADGVDAFWRLLRDGVDAVREVPADRWDADAYYDVDPGVPGRMNTRWGGFLDGIDLFDPQFFGISPREAVGMDPQQRLLLEVCWEALEHAAMAPDRLRGSSTGVFVGVSGLDYLQLVLQGSGSSDTYFATGLSHAVASGRISYILGLRGPSLSVDTACSSSLVALHLACRSLHLGECRVALAGGVNVILTPETTLALSTARMMAADGRCKAFSADADGFVRGEGCGVVVLKRLDDARADGDRVLAVIAGSAVNQDGRSSGLTAPNGPSQEDVIREALRCAGCLPSDVDYVEAHGTGTPLGDPIEVQALAAVLGEGRPRERPVLIGSVKTNVGHLESSAGVAGLIKVVLAMKNDVVPAHLHVNGLNAHIPWESLPVRVTVEETPWPRGERRRLAGVSSFGFSGTNVHMVVSEAPVPADAPAFAAERPVHVLRLSAGSAGALQRLAGRYAGYLAEDPESQLGDVCFTANTGRALLGYRAGIVAATVGEAREALASIEGASDDPRVATTASLDYRPEVAFLFPGHGPQYADMGRALCESEPAFQRTLDRCDEILTPLLGRSLESIIWGGEAERALEETRYTQPALFAFEVALADLWRSWGVEPAMVLGHSLGEYAAACVAGVFSLEDGLRLVATRGRLLHDLPAGGGMAALGADVDRVRRLIAREGVDVSIAAINGPVNTAISGAWFDVERVVQRLEAEGGQVHRIAVAQASHSPLLEPMLDELADAAASITMKPPGLALVSNLTGGLAGPELLTRPEYWRRHAREAVQFESGMHALYDLGCRVFLEVGPSPVLTGMGRACVDDPSCLWAASLKKGQPDSQRMAEALRDLSLRGVEVDWAAYDAGRPRHRLALPTTPFDRRRYYVEPGRGSGVGAHAPDGVFSARVETVRGETILDGALGIQGLPFLDAHRVHGQRVVPAPVHLALVAQGADAARGSGLALRDVAVEAPLVLPESGSVPVQVIFSGGARGAAEGTTVEVHSRSGRRGAWVRHLSATIGAAPSDAGAATDLAALRARCAEAVDPDTLYERLERIGVAIGPPCRALEAIWRGTGEAVARLGLPADADTPSFAVHPVLVDACLHLLGVVVPESDHDDAHLMVGADRWTLASAMPSTVWAHLALRPSAGDEELFAADARIFDEDGRQLAELGGIRLRRATRDALLHALRPTQDDWLYNVEWREAPLSSSAPPSGNAPEWSPASIARELVDVPESLALEHGLAEFPAMIEGLDTLALEYLVAAFEKLGWDPRVGEHVEAETLAAVLSIAAPHRMLFDRLLEMLEEGGYLAARDGGYAVVSAPSASSAGQTDGRAAALADRFPGYAGAVTLLQAAGERLDAVLRGEEDPVRVLFADASLDAVEAVTRHAPSAKVFNGLLGRIVQEATSSAPGRDLRVLEIGAGTGATTASLLPVLAPDRTEYVFTDVSQVFLSRARDTFSDFPFVDYRLLDIEVAPADQGFTPGSFDIVVASNVLHATRDLSESILHARSLLRPGGLLLLMEGTAKQRWLDLTFGLTSGWWRFADRELRPSYPLMASDRWRELMPSLGFDEVALLPELTSLASAPDQMVLAARVPVTSAPTDAASAEAASRGCWLVMGGGRALSDAVAAELRARGYAPVVVGPPTEAGPEEEPAVSVPRVDMDLADPGAFVGLLSHPRVLAGGPLLGCIHLVATEATPADELTAEILDDDATGACRSALFTVQTLVGSTGGDALVPRLWLVTREAVGDSPRARLGGAPLWGLGRTILMEHPEVWGGSIDVDDRAAPAAAVAIVDEIESGSGEDEVLIRAQGRRVARLVPAAVPQVGGPVELRADATYLLTGASGGMGLLVARWLVRCGARHLMLVSRGGRLPEGEDAALRVSGADVRVRSADVSRREDVTRVIEEIRSEMPPLAGVVHGAGVFDDRILRNQDWPRFARVLAPKVTGAWLLHEVTRDTELDFFLLFSSAASVLGPVGLSNYAAANTFLDALALTRRAQGLPAVAIDWGAWEKTGMAEAVGQRRENQWTVSGFDTITSEEGLEIVERAVGQAPAQVTVLPMTWPAYLEWLGESRQHALFHEVAKASARVRPRDEDRAAAESTVGPADVRRRVRTLAPAEARATLTDCIAGEAMRVLGFDAGQSMDTARSLFQLGMDSLTAVEMKNRLQTMAGHPLPPAVVFDHPSIDAMVTYLWALPDFAGQSNEGSDTAQVAGDHAASLLERLPDLSDEEVAQLLERMSQDEAAG